MNKLGGKMPALRSLEMKLDMMNELKPELKSLVDDVTKITDSSDMIKAKEGGR